MGFENERYTCNFKLYFSSPLINYMKLSVEGYISHEQSESWTRCGLAVIFEGLLSVKGKERAMLEDAYSAIETIRDFRVRVRQLQDRSISEDNQRVEVEVFGQVKKNVFFIQSASCALSVTISFLESIFDHFLPNTTNNIGDPYIPSLSKYTIPSSRLSF